MAVDLLGKRALVVGASAGIGREIGLRLSALGAEVAFHGRRADRLDDAVKTAGRGCAVVADLTDPDGCTALVAEAVERLSGLDLLVHAASASRISLLADTSAEEWADVYQTNVIAPALVVRAAVEHLTPGAIAAVISSESVGMPYHGLLPYGSSKAALEEIVRGLRLEHPEYRFACIRVGQTGPTDFARDFDPEMAAELFPKWIGIGRIPAQSMDVVEVGRVIADSLALGLETPSVELQDMILRAPGGVFTGAVDDMLSDVDAAHDAVHGTRDG